MDNIVTIISIAVSCIIIGKIFFKKKSANTNKEKVDTWLIECALRGSFGTTDIPFALEYAKRLPDPKPDTWLIECALRESFGTTNLDYVFENYMSRENREKFKQQLQQR
ncbi:MAG: hypothetical protein H6Q70_81 [Firmicutes bacterium]|nr:hypothetical protein [Bacillota bacterium]